MDPARPRPSPAPHPRRHPDDRDAPAHSLPSIHQLHPDLPHTAIQSLPIPGPPSSYPHPHPHQHQHQHQHQHHQPAPTTTYPVASASSLGTRPPPDDRDSDPDADSQEPPKKKRRRQALSCTECKRRKIKCDRAQPCGPCARRGEHNKCQWHIIEPMEKYVTRTEYDDLKARVYELESIISRIPGVPSARMSIPPPVMTHGPVAEPVQGTVITPYHQAFSTAAPPSAHHTMPPSARSPAHGEPPQPPGRPSRSSARSSPPAYRPHTSHGSSSTGRAFLASAAPAQPAPPPGSPALSKSPPQPYGSRSPTVTTSRPPEPVKKSQRADANAAGPASAPGSSSYRLGPGGTRSPPSTASAPRRRSAAGYGESMAARPASGPVEAPEAPARHPPRKQSSSSQPPRPVHPAPAHGNQPPQGATGDTALEDAKRQARPGSSRA